MESKDPCGSFPHSSIRDRDSTDKMTLEDCVVTQPHLFEPLYGRHGLHKLVRWRSTIRTIAKHRSDWWAINNVLLYKSSSFRNFNLLTDFISEWMKSTWFDNKVFLLHLLEWNNWVYFHVQFRCKIFHGRNSFRCCDYFGAIICKDFDWKFYMPVWTWQRT